MKRHHVVITALMLLIIASGVVGSYVFLVIEPCKRLKPLDAAIQAIRVNDGKEDDAADAEAKKQPVADDRTRLIGNWTVTSVEDNGAEDDTPRWSSMSVYEDAQMQLLRMDLTDAQVNTAVNDLYAMSMKSKANSGQMDISFGGPGSLAKANYQLQGDTLVICIGEDQPAGGIIQKPRPKSFTTKSDDGQLLLRLRRAKPAETKSP